MTVALHRIRFSGTNSAYLDIEWTKGKGEPVTPLPDVPAVTVCERELELDEFAQKDVPALCWRGDAPLLFQPLQLRENTDYYVDIRLPLSKAEAETRAQQSQSWPFEERLGAVFKADPSRRWSEPEQGAVVVSGQLRLRNHAGVLNLSIESGLQLRAEVVCRKLNYLTEFQVLLRDVAEFLAELLLQYDSPVSIAFELSDARLADPAALLFQLRYIMANENLPLAVEEVIDQLHVALVSKPLMRDISEVEEVNEEGLIDALDISLFESGGPLSALFRGFTPRELPILDVSEITDTPENRYVKHFLEECSLLAQWLSSHLAEKKKVAAAREAEGWFLRLQELLARESWRSIGPMRQFPSNSQVLLKRRGYRDILRFDLALRLGLTLPWNQGQKLAEGLNGDIRPVNELYEYWCFFLLRRALADICNTAPPDERSLLSITKDGLQVKLAKGTRSRTVFVYSSSPEKRVMVTLFYNRRFRRPTKNLPIWEGSYTAAFDPDYSISIAVTEGTSTQRHWLHFDAKYRLEQAELGAMLNERGDGAERDPEDDEAGYEQEISRLHRRDDLFKMHTYRDGILSTRGAYILFPGDGAGLRTQGRTKNFFVRDPAAFDGLSVHKIPSVGAFDLCPGRDEGQIIVLKDFLAAVLRAVSTADAYQEETGLV
jgi:predicted component of viral defense system (DUF524 family)